MLRRSYLFVPGNRPKMIEHADRSAADLLVVDLEDAVPAAEKTAARQALEAAAGSLTAPATRVFVRINSGPEQAADLHAVSRLAIAGLVVPKVEGPEDLARVDAWLDRLPDEAPARRGALIALIETPAGVLRAARLVEAAIPRLVALAFGAEDYRAAIGVADADGRPLLDFARSTVATAAAAAHLAAIDSPTFDVHDLDRLREETGRARDFGFRAKFAIHPAQIPVIHEVLSPTAGERAWAQRVLDAYDEAARAGRGSAALDGRMIDTATVQRAQLLLGER
ncbi:MAG TPA: CoA ester lyase [Vicinamibacterales bacterium]|nr:CoA ester lyase [Vicinamibacterales bacterium]